MKFIYIKDDSSKFKEYNLSKFKLVFLIFTICSVIVVPTIFLSHNYFKLNHDLHLSEKLDPLSSSISSSLDDISYIKKEIDRIHRKDDTIRSMVGLPIIDLDIRKMGTGGEEEELEDLNYFFEDEFEHDVVSYIETIDYLRRIVGMEIISYRDIANFIDKNLSYILRKPAIHPVNMNECDMSSSYGFRRDPYTKRYKMHEGQDFSGKVGTPIYATADGVVKSSKRYGSYGNYIEIDHGNGYVTIYAHLNKRITKRGASVTRGDQIGTLGNTGRSTAAHLHYEVKYRGKNLDPQDYYFDKNIY
tara:strand:- start:41 stop:946 length:906 start_codon:yes stop_codon:yes gene_type:complete